MADLFSLGVEMDTRRVQQGTAHLDSFNRSATGSIAAITGIVAAAVGLNKSIDTIAKFEDSMLGLQATINGTASQMAALEKQARTLGATSVYSAEQSAQAQRFLAQAGFSVDEVMKSTAATMQLATAGQLSLAEAADIASNVLGGMRLEVDQLNRVNDVMAKTAASSNTNIQQLGEALSYAAPLAATAGVSIEEVSAAVGKLSDAGLQGSRAGTGIIGFIRQLSKVTPKAAAALANYGLTADDVNIEVNGLLNVMDRLAAAGISTADSIAIFGSEAAPAAGILSASAASARELTTELRNSEGAAKDMADIMGSGLSSAFKGFNSQIQESILNLGDSGLAAALMSVTESATGVLAVYNDLLPEYAEANELTGDQVENLDRLAGYVEAYAGAIGGAVVGLGAYRAAAWAATTATTGLSAAMRANPLGLLATAVGVVAGLYITLGENMDTAAEAADKLNKGTAALTITQKENARVSINSRLIQLEAELEVMQEQEKVLNKQAEAGATVLYLGRAPVGGVEAIDDTIKDISEVEQEIEKLNIALEKLDEKTSTPTVIEITAGAGVDELVPNSEKMINIFSDGINVADDFSDVLTNNLTPALAELFGMESGLVSEIDDISHGFEYMTQSISDAMRAFSEFSENGGEGAQKMAAAADTLNYVLAATAALNAMAHASNVYEAIAAGAAMAAAVAGIGYSIGGITGSFESGAERRQESQGTGTVLGGSLEKSESILNGIENSADALEQIVGINTDGFEALKSVLIGITGASNLVARDVSYGNLNQLASVDGFLEQFDPLSNLALNFANSLGGVGDIVTNALNELAGGKSRISDEGLMFAEGRISDVLNEGFVQAFAEVGEKKNVFDDWDYDVRKGGVTDQLSNQIALVYRSMTDSVIASSKMLGMDASDAVNDYVFDAITVSLRGLSSSEQASELESVFSSIYDNFAASIIPISLEFQRAGEGVGETVARLSTDMAVVEQVISQLNLSDISGSADDVIRISNSFSELAGGASELAGQLNGFVETFATQERQLEILTDGLTEALGAQDVAILKSRDGVYDYIASLEKLDGDNAERITNILGLTDSLDEYFDLLDSINISTSEHVELMIQLADAQNNEALAERLTLEQDLASATSNVTRGYIKAISQAQRMAAALDLESSLDVWSESMTQTQQNLELANNALSALGMTGMTYMSSLRQLGELGGDELSDLADDLGISFDKLEEYILSIKTASESVTDNSSDGIVSNARARVTGLQGTIDSAVSQYFDGVLPTAEDISNKIMLMSLDIQSNAVDYDSLLEPYANIVGAIESSAGQQIEQIGDLHGAYFTALGEYFGRSVSDIVDTSAIQDEALKELNAYSNQMRGRNLLTDEIEQWSQSLADGLFDVSDMKGWIDDAEETGIYQSFQAVKDLISSVSDQSDMSGIDDLRALQNAMSNLPAAQTALQEAIEALAESDAVELSNEFGEAISKQRQLQSSILSAQGDTAAIQAAEIDAIKEINGWRQYNLVGLQQELNAIEDYASTVGMVRDALALDEISAQQAMQTLSIFGDSVKQVIETVSSLNQSDLENYLSDLGISAADLEDNLEPLIDVFNDAKDALGTALEQAEAAADDAISILARSISAEKELLKTAYDNQSELLQNSIESTAESISDLESVADSLKDAISNVVDLSTAQQRAQLEAARNQLSYLADSGIIPNQDTLDDLLNVVTSDNAKYYETAVDYRREQGRTANDIALLSELADGQLTEAERALKAQEESLEVLENTYNADIDALDAQLDAYQNQLDALNGINVSVMTVAEAIANMESSLTDLYSAQSNSGSSAVNTGVSTSVSPYSDEVLDAARTYYDYENTGYVSGDTAGAIEKLTAAGISDKSQLNDVYKYIEGAYANGGTSSGGLAMVGERGPEIINMPAGTHVSTANQTKSMLDNSELIELVRELIDKTIVQNGYVKSSRDILNRTSNGGNAFNTSTVVVKTI